MCFEGVSIAAYSASGALVALCVLKELVLVLTVHQVHWLLYVF